MNFLFITFEKNFCDSEMFRYFVKLGKIFLVCKFNHFQHGGQTSPDFQKQVCLLWEKCLLWVCLLWEGKVFFRYRELKTLSDSSSTIVYFPKLRMRLKVDESIYRFIFKRNLCHIKIWKKCFQTFSYFNSMYIQKVRANGLTHHLKNFRYFLIAKVDQNI